MFLNSKIVYLSFILLFAAYATDASTLDSLRVEKIKGQHFVIHRVDQGETLYSLSRRYGCTVDQLNAHNPTLSTGLKIFDELKIPIAKPKGKKRKSKKATTDQPQTTTHIVQAGETLYSIARKYQINLDTLKSINGLKANNISVSDTLRLVSVTSVRDTEKEALVNNEKIQDTVNYHIVKPKETMLSLTRKYGVSLDSLMAWNGLTNYNISIGQKLIVQNNVQLDEQNEAPQETQFNDLIEVQAVPDTIYVKTDEREFKTKISEVEGKSFINQEGFAMRIEDTSFTTKLLALHRTAPMGTSVTIENQMNNKVIEVRVVGKLPDTAINKNVLLRLSDAAYKQLGALDLKVPISSRYEQE